MNICKDGESFLYPSSISCDYHMQYSDSNCMHIRLDHALGLNAFSNKIPPPLVVTNTNINGGCFCASGLILALNLPMCMLGVGYNFIPNLHHTNGMLAEAIKLQASII